MQPHNARATASLVVSPVLKRSSTVRCHHLLKTFYTAVGGWADRQLPDGTVIWTAPSGQVYTTKPGGALFFPALATPTGQLVLPESSGPAQANRGLMMPTRQTHPGPRTRIPHR